MLILESFYNISSIVKHCYKYKYFRTSFIVCKNEDKFTMTLQCTHTTINPNIEN